MVLLEGGFHPVFVSHSGELEQMLFFLADLQKRIRGTGLDTGEQYDCLLRVRRKCSDLLLKLYAEDSEIILLNDLDSRWIRLISGFVRDVLKKDHRKAG